MAKEKPIGFTAEMIRARREGRKNVTRRVMIPQPEWRPKPPNSLQAAGWAWSTKKVTLSSWDDIVKFKDEITQYAPYQPGDLLWTKETYCHGIEWDDCKPSEVDPLCGGNDIWYLADGPRPTEGWGKTRSGMFMPKWVARDWIEVIGNRAERLQDITEEDCLSEGITRSVGNSGVGGHMHHDWFYKAFPEKGGGFASAKEAYECLWDSINAKRGYPWEINPWCWVLSFKQVKP